MTAGAFVRAADPRDADAIGRLQARAWAENHAAALGAQVTAIDAENMARIWADAISGPPTAAHRVLVARDGEEVVGFAATAPDGSATEIVALEVDPARTGLGHGSRLLAACVDLARDGGAGSILCWVLEDDGARAGFLRAAGLAPDGVRRTLDIAGRGVREERWAAAL